MFGLGMGEIVIILVLALVLLGPQKLPDAAKQIGKGLREFRKATEDLKQQFESELYAPDQKQPPKPTLVGSQTPPAEGEPPAVIPPGGIPLATGEVPAASADNIPGLEAALAEPQAAPPAASPGALTAPPATAPAPPAEATSKAS